MVGRLCIVTGVALVGFGGVLGALDLWGGQLERTYARMIGYDGCMCEQCEDQYLGSFWVEHSGCNGPRHDRLWAGGWSAGVGSGLAAAPWGLLALRRRERRRRGRCPCCGYDKRGLPTLVCPECGNAGSKF